MATSITMAFLSNFDSDRHKTYLSPSNSEKFVEDHSRVWDDSNLSSQVNEHQPKLDMWVEMRMCACFANDKLNDMSPNVRPHILYTHSILLNIVWNSIVFICDVLSLHSTSSPLSTISIRIVSIVFDYDIWLFSSLCALSDVSCIDQRWLSSLIDRAIIFLLSSFFFLSLHRGCFIHSDFVHLFRPVCLSLVPYSCICFLIQWILSSSVS